ncbi:MAG: hypothetical protein GWO02_13010 [Gammaproteobacteria bacterium]|nr:hypothetical protein [Gammaproteobacteria bacterium]
MGRRHLQVTVGLGLALFLLAPASGCSRIHDPWVQSGDELKQERTRSEQTQEQLRHRVLAGQTDR